MRIQHLGYAFWLSLLLFPPKVLGLIGGYPVSAAQFTQVVETQSGNIQCTAAFIAPNLLLFAAHCLSAQTPVVTFKSAGQSYLAIGIRNQANASDLAAAKLLGSFRSASPFSVRGKPEINDTVLLLGYGCPQAGVKADGILRVGAAKVNKVAETSFKTTGPSVCTYDAGGPVLNLPAPGFAQTLIGVASYGDEVSSSFITRIDSLEAKAFFERIIQNYDVQICGINLSCSPETLHSLNLAH